MLATKDFHSQVIDFERSLLRRALIDNDKSPTRAARALGFENHQTLLAMLNHRHKELRDELGITKRVRRKPLMRKGSL